MAAKSIHAEGRKDFRVGCTKELAEAVECGGIQHSWILADGFIGDALLQSIDVAAKGRKLQSGGRWCVACLDGL